MKYKMNPFKVFEENVRCKILYYSCITPHTIAEVNRTLGYKSPTYLYQRNSLALLGEAGLIKSIEGSEKRKAIQTNYEAIFEKTLLEETLKDINDVIEVNFLTYWESEISESDLEIKKFREMIINGLSAEERDILTHKKFSKEEFDSLAAFWKNPIFRDVIFSLDVISKVDKHRLPDNPLFYIINVMFGIFERYYGYFYPDNIPLEIPWTLSMYIDTLYPAYYKSIKSAIDNASSDDFQEFKEKHQVTFDLICQKFRPMEAEERHKDIPTMEIIKLTGLKKPKED